MFAMRNVLEWLEITLFPFQDACYSLFEMNHTIYNSQHLEEICKPDMNCIGAYWLQYIHENQGFSPEMI